MHVSCGQEQLPVDKNGDVQRKDERKREPKWLAPFLPLPAIKNFFPNVLIFKIYLRGKEIRLRNLPPVGLLPKCLHGWN